MRKVVSVLLCVVILLAVTGSLTACHKETGPLRILVDMGQIEHLPVNDVDSYLKSATETLMAYVAAAGGPEDVEITVVPVDEEERHLVLTRTRTEMMAGQGPDVFICACSTEDDALFLMPEKSMELGLLLPLDEYIENAQYMEWDKLTPAVMDVGQTERWGRVLLPMTYSFAFSSFSSNDLASHTPSEDLTWDDMKNNADPVLRESVYASANYYNFGKFEHKFGKLANYREKKLLFTEEELLEYANELIEIYRNRESSSIAVFPARMAMGHEETPYEAREELSVWVPLYSEAGGITATVHAFAAINANTKRPDDAFMVLDQLFSKDFIMYSSLWGWAADECGLYVHEDFTTPAQPVKTLTSPQWSFSQEEYERFAAMRDCITNVNICGTLDVELRDLYHTLIVFDQETYTIHPDDGLDVAAAVHEFYSRMQKEVSE